MKAKGTSQEKQIVKLSISHKKNSQNGTDLCNTGSRLEKSDSRMSSSFAYQNVQTEGQQQRQAHAPKHQKSQSRNYEHLDNS